MQNNNFSPQFNTQLNHLNYSLGKLFGNNNEFTFEDMMRLQEQLMEISAELDGMLSRVMQLTQRINKESKIPVD